MLQVLQRPPFVIHHYDSLGSTNDQLKRMVEAPEFTCVVADEQTAGRGRRRRTWLSTPGDGLYLSILLRPAWPPQQIPLLSLMASVVVAEVVMRRGVGGVDIKWPNDVLAGGRKLSGILVEGASAGAGTPRLVVGLGVNLNHRTFPPELSGTATSLILECGRPTDPAEFRDALLDLFAEWYLSASHDGGQSITRRWQELSSYARSKQVAVTLDEEQLVGETAGLTETGALLLRTRAGGLRAILAGEVRRLRENEE